MQDRTHDPAGKTLNVLEAIATNPAAPGEHRDAARHAIDLIVAGCHTADRWGGPHNAEVRADVLMPTTVRGTGAAGRNALIEALDELARRCTSPAVTS